LQVFAVILLIMPRSRAFTSVSYVHNLKYFFCMASHLAKLLLVLASMLIISWCLQRSL